MARPADLIEDHTELDGPRIDVGSRCGWLLRASRLAGGLSLSDMARRLQQHGAPASASRLSQVETGGVRNGRVVDGYERVLGLERGRLRAPVDVLCRTFAYSPADIGPDPVPDGLLSAFDRAVAPVLDGAAVGADWLGFARAHDASSAFGLPTRSMRPLVDRLTGELARAVGTGFATRYEALARLRCGPYADVVAGSVRALVEDPDTQVLLDAMSVVSELPSAALLDWCGELLAARSSYVARGGALALENMRGVGGLGPSTWARLEDPFVAAYEGGDDERRGLLTTLFKNLPGDLRRRIQARLTAPLASVRGPDTWQRSRFNRHLGTARALATAACHEVGLPAQPMLTRLLFEVLYDFRSSRAVTSGFVITASPFLPALLPLLVRAAEDDPDPTTRDGATGALTGLQSAHDHPVVDGWLDDDDPDRVAAALGVAAHAGTQVPAGRLTSLACAPATHRMAMYAAGMAAHPVLRTWVDEEPSLRPAAAWWLREGGRLLV